MPPLPAFTDNPLLTRPDHYRAILTILRPLLPYFSPSCTSINLPNHGNLPEEDRKSAGIEAFATPLWLVGALWQGYRSLHEAALANEVLNVTKAWGDGLVAAFDPASEGYWGPGGGFATMEGGWRVVEVVGRVVVECRTEVWGRLSGEGEADVVSWFGKVVGSAAEGGGGGGEGGRWGRVFAGGALVRLGVEGVEAVVNRDLEGLGAFYGECDDGWVAGEDKGLEGSAEMHFRSLLFGRLYSSSVFDPMKDRYIEQAKFFSWDIQGFVNMQGAPFGLGPGIRDHLCVAVFLAALAYTKTPNRLEVSPYPIGALKGFLMRSLRWFAANSGDDFDEEGILCTRAEAGSTGRLESPYWSLKCFIAVAIHAQEDFWLALEVKHHWDPLYPRFMGLRQGKMVCQNPDYGRTTMA